MKRTQVGGKYVNGSAVFSLKNELVNAGILVRHPILDSVVGSLEGVGVAFDSEQWSFEEVEADYYRSIADCDFHAVGNWIPGHPGYLGKNAAVEVAHAMILGKPILFSHEISLSNSLDPAIAATIISNRKKFVYVESFDASGVGQALIDLPDDRVAYCLKSEDFAIVSQAVASILANPAR